MDGPLTDAPLHGVRVLEVGGGIPAAFAAHLLGGYGAEVVRVEGLWEPVLPLTDDEELYLLAGKRRVAGVDGGTLARLAAAADIVIEDSPPGTVDVASWRRERPELVVVSVTPFGQDGPRATEPADNLISFAASGMMSLTGDPDRAPLVTGGSQAQYVGGLNAFSAALAAHFGAVMQGEGDHVDLSIQECLAGMLELYGPASAAGEPPALRFGNYHRAAWALYPCGDGFAGVFCLERQIPALFAAIGAPELDEARFRDPVQRSEHDEELSAHVISWMVDHTGDELLAIGQQRRIPLGKVRTPAELLGSPALVERGFFDDVCRAGTAATTRVPGRPFAGLGWQGGGVLTAAEPAPDGVLAAWGVS
jgi:CoA:oxalate CoA-transferase